MLKRRDGRDCREDFAARRRCGARVLLDSGGTDSRGIEATGSMQWFLELMEELGIDCQVGHPAKIRAAEPRKQKHDRRDAALVLQLLVENRFPSIWMPSREQRDVRSLILYRRQWVRIRTRVQNALQAIVFSHGLRGGLCSLYSRTADRTAIAGWASRETDR